MIENTKYPRSEHFSFSEGATNDDRISKEFDFLENIEIVGTEKLDGQNNALTKSAPYARSHALPTELPWDIKIREIHNRVKHLLSTEEYIFGENMYAIHAIEYTKLTSPFYIFGVRVKDEWLAWDDVLEYGYILDIPIVPTLYRGTTNDIKSLVSDLVSKESKLGGFDTKSGKKMMEGMVVRNVNNYTQENFAKNLLKWVRKDHVCATEHWTRNWKKANIKY